MLMPIRFRLKELMIERNLTYEDVSRGARVSTGALYKLRENKQKQIGVEVLGRLLDYLNCEPGDLIEKIKK